MAHKTHTRLYLIIWVLLLILTFVTVKVSYYDFGIWNIVVAMLVATVKGALVILFFMHLIDDRRLNQVVFGSAFAFLALFIGLTASDLFFRTAEGPTAVSSEIPVVAASSGEIVKWRTPTPALVEAGQSIYAAQCALCHGAAGAGDGAAAAALNPSPRNFTESAGWTFGRSPSALFKTVTEGSPGTTMAPFGSLAVKERWAVVHYLGTLMTDQPADTEADQAAIAGGGAIAKPRIPLSMAMELIAVPD